MRGHVRSSPMGDSRVGREDDPGPTSPFTASERPVRPVYPMESSDGRPPRGVRGPDRRGRPCPQPFPNHNDKFAPDGKPAPLGMRTLEL
jgi:hypothetical protein